MNILQKISEAVRYPLVLASVVFSVLIFWICFIVPKFAELFVGMNVELTILTKCVIAISNFLNSWISAFLCVFFISIFFVFSKTNYSKQILQIFFKRIGLTRLKFYIEFFYGMNLMLEEKLHLIECLEMFLNSENSDVIKDIVCMIKQGKSLATAMETSGVFRHTEISIIETGEQCGDLATSFCVAANNIKNNFETKSKKVIGILQPCLMLIIGGILILIICALIMPIYSTLEYVNI